MAAYKKLEPADFKKILNDVIIISFRYSIISGKNPNDIERVYNSIATKISENNVYYRNELKEIYVEDNDFVPLFNNKVFSDSRRNVKIIKYILGKYERFIGGTRDVPTYSETDTVEHILPQNPGDEWGDDNYSFDTLIYRLGNMCLLEKNFNKVIQNKSYKDKCFILKQSAFVSTKSIPETYKNWNADSISRRQQTMGDCAKSIWKIIFNT